jgi:pilus assembly protein Flp/PilA
MKPRAPLAWARILANEKGVTAIEYSLIASLLAILIITGVTLIGGHLSTIFQSVADKW